MIVLEWHTLPIIGTGAIPFDLRRPDLSAIVGATGNFGSAIDDGVEMLCLVEVEDGN